MTATRNGVPLYADPKAAPDYLKSRSKLAKLGLRPTDADQPDAYVKWSDGSRDPYAVYDARTAEKIPAPPSREQRKRDRDDAADRARAALGSPNAVVVDTETTGLDGLVIEIAAVAADGTVIVDQLINPGVPITADATKVHGLTFADVGNSPTFADVAAQLAEALDGRPVIAWNGSFDQQALRRSADAAGLDVPGWVAASWSDAMLWHARHVGEWDEQRGEYRRHRADGDHRCVSDCGAVWNKVRSMAGHGPDARTVASIRAQILRALDSGAYDDLPGPDAARTIAATLGAIQESAA